jgi:energy-coupling factor transporter ATP-binding protein EcfA2
LFLSLGTSSPQQLNDYLFTLPPHAGLDAFQALSVMNTMQKLARGGRTVVASIHQPRSAIYELLDHLVLISEGRTVYRGDAKDAAAFFAALGFVCPPLFNQGDFFLDTISMVREPVGLIAGGGGGGGGGG